jgi:hypothetical protein
LQVADRVAAATYYTVSTEGIGIAPIVSDLVRLHVHSTLSHRSRPRTRSASKTKTKDTHKSCCLS